MSILNKIKEKTFKNQKLVPARTVKTKMIKDKKLITLQ